MVTRKGSCQTTCHFWNRTLWNSNEISWGILARLTLLPRITHLCNSYFPRFTPYKNPHIPYLTEKWKRLHHSYQHSQIQPNKNVSTFNVSSTSSILNRSNAKLKSYLSDPKRERKERKIIILFHLQHALYLLIKLSLPGFLLGSNLQRKSFVRESKKKKKNMFNYSRLESMERVVAPDIITRRHKVAAIISIQDSLSSD